jgi:hypothetical protein
MTPSKSCTVANALHTSLLHHVIAAQQRFLHILLGLQVPSMNHGSLAGILSHTSYTPPGLTPVAASPLRCSACGTSADGIMPPAVAPVSPSQVLPF